MAHVNDSQIQAHSMGDIYPYVICRTEIYNRGKFWSVIQPDGEQVGAFLTYDAAYLYAKFAKDFNSACFMVDKEAA